MIASTEVLDALKSIGLNLYERKIFTALLAKGVATAAEVSEIAKVPRSRSYDVLESLADKGFVVVQPSKPIKYVALAPKEALERTKETMQKKHEEILARIDKLVESKIMDELNRIHKQSLSMVKPTDFTTTLKGTLMIDRQLKSVLKDAKKSVNIITTESGLSHLYDTHLKTLRKLSKKGVKVNIMAPMNDQKIAKELAEVADLKSIDAPLGRICTVDGEHLLMALTDEKVHESQDVALWASSQEAVKSVSPLFEQAVKAVKK